MPPQNVVACSLQELFKDSLLQLGKILMYFCFWDSCFKILKKTHRENELFSSVQFRERGKSGVSEQRNNASCLGYHVPTHIKKEFHSMTQEPWMVAQKWW